MESSLLHLPEGVVPEGVEPLCRCHQAVKDGEFYYAGDRLYCRSASIAQWTFKSPVTEGTVKKILHQLLGGTQVQYFAWGEYHQGTYCRYDEREASVFHFLFNKLSDDTCDLVDPSSPVRNGVEMPPMDGRATWVEPVSCQTPLRMKQLDERLGMGPICEETVGNRYFGKYDVYRYQLPFWTWR